MQKKEEFRKLRRGKENAETAFGVTPDRGIKEAQAVDEG